MNQRTIRAQITPTPDLPLDTPSGVGLCLSGGGSRAMTAGLGQLRALHHLQANGQNLLSQIEALSTVSGGSWLSVPWTFLPAEFADVDFLGRYEEPQALSPASLSNLPKASPGRNIGRSFTILDLVIDAIGLRLIHGTPFDSMWQILMGRRLLSPYGLYTAGPKAEPTSTFSLDQQTKRTALTDPNPQLADAVVHLVADAGDAERTRRALLMCNSSLFVSQPGSELEFLAPVVFTPTSAGVLSSPRGVTAAGEPVGGGVIDAFAFNSALVTNDNNDVEVLQDRQLALADIVGLSSAAFAETVENLGENAAAESSKQRRRYLRERLRIERSLGETPKRPSIFHRVFDWIRAFALHRILRRLSPRDLVPSYRYWPVGDPDPDPTIGPSRFADGGSLENTGVASMLTRTKIDRIIACLNSEDELKPARVGVVDIAANGSVSEQHGTKIQVASEVAYLFGYQEHDDELGYLKFEGVPDEELGDQALFKHNHVFESASFAELLRKFADASGEGLRTKPVVVRQKLRTVENHWFGIGGGRSVTVVWVYLNPVEQWTASLVPEVKKIVADTDAFPNYLTLRPQLTATEFSLLSAQTAWSMAREPTAGIFRELFT